MPPWHAQGDESSKLLRLCFGEFFWLTPSSHHWLDNVGPQPCLSFFFIDYLMSY